MAIHASPDTVGNQEATKIPAWKLNTHFSIDTLLLPTGFYGKLKVLFFIIFTAQTRTRTRTGDGEATHTKVPMTTNRPTVVHEAELKTNIDRPPKLSGWR